ncbi:hypothetical protein PMI21_01063 [Pseudomonas sp. GM18]|uniref:hypothetical protein n=1 Tax=Pseudomonas sp. GM18 TaxID=1144324 RepID=UPI000272603D|nr:hypothetical protein [Pseudomonas sp. GM18]EJM20161.1 hypothetical protein PMI21_01063 [Pseudomonas sp. GM18]
MAYAIRNDGQSWRSVNSADDVMEGEHYSAETPEVVTPTLTREQVEDSRLRAYADPITGSDRYFAEAARIQAMGGTLENVEVARAAGAARSAAIQALYPWPE